MIKDHQSRILRDFIRILSIQLTQLILKIQIKITLWGSGVKN